MKLIADFHLHSKYSRATSGRSDLESFDQWANIKGVKILGTGDFTHPQWFKNLKEKLRPSEPGLFKLAPYRNEVSGAGLKNSNSETRFVLTAEISCIYSKLGKVRKIHVVLLAPSFEAAEKINTRLNKIGNLKSDGRPILGLDAKELAKIVLDASEDCMVIPAHAWTPWFSIFGSRSGFDSIEECFDDYSKYIFAVETGLSSNPAMNWQLSALDKISLISCSDAHSPPNIGREASVFDTDLDYYQIAAAIKKKDPKKFLYTVEFYPEEGKYHFDGHRSCDISLNPGETKKYNGLCPVCQKPLVVGVLNRVAQLADRKEGFVPKNAVPFKSLIPLSEIVAEVVGQGKGTKAVEREYKKLIEKFGSEFNILLDASKKDLEAGTSPEIAEGVIRAREGKIYIEPGYDGVYGKVKIFTQGREKNLARQGLLL